MSSLVAIWGAMTGACLVIALMNIGIWLRERGRLGFLLIGLVALAAAFFGHIEIRLMKMASVEEAMGLYRLAHVVLFVVTVALALHVHIHFGTGRLWLLGALIAVRTGVLVANFASAGNVHYLSVHSLRTVLFLGEPVAMVNEAAPNPWAVLIPVSSLLFVAYVVDASMALWRKGGADLRRRALIVGGGIVLTVAVSSGVTILKQYADLDWPYLVTPSFVFIVAAVGFDLGSEVLHTAALSEGLAASQARLGIAERRLRMAMEAAGVSMWEWDRATDRIHLSAPGQVLLGVPPGAPISGAEFFDRIHPSERAAVRSMLEGAVAGDGDFHIQFRVLRDDGGPRWLALRGSVADAPSGGTLVMRGVIADVTERVEADARVDLIANASPIGIVMVNRAGRIVFANRQAESMFGYDEGELLGNPVDRLVPDALRERHEEHRGAFFRAGQAGPMRAGRYVFGARKDRSEISLEVSLVPVRLHDEDVVVASLIDQSWRHEAEAELASRRDELVHLSRVSLLGELSGSLAHELNQPLTAILGNAQAAQQLALQGRLSPEVVSEILDDIVSDTRRAGEVIRRLRTLLRRGNLVVERVDLATIAAEVLQLMSSDLIERRVLVTTDFAPGLPEVLADRVQLQQVVLNLVINACDAMTAEPGQRRLEVRVDRGGEDRVRLCVADNGPGIAQDKLDHIFEPFVTTKSQGLGLGLSLCRTIVEHHGGTIEAANRPEGGATFCFELRAVSGEGS